MTKKSGSYVYILSKDGNVKVRGHKNTMNQAKEFGLDYIYSTGKPFYRFTKIPFPFLFYVNDEYVVYVVYASLDDEDIPYSVKLSDFDTEVVAAMEHFTNNFGKEFYYDKDSRTKSRDLSKKHIRRTKNARLSEQNKRKHYNTYSD